MSKKIAVLGIGNDFRGDDSLGLIAARKAHSYFAGQTSTQKVSCDGAFELNKSSNSHSVNAIESQGEITQILDCFEKHDVVFVIDAVKTDSLVVGEVVRIDVNDKDNLFQLEKISAGTSTHSFSLKQAIDLAQALHTRPSKLIIYGIAGKNFSTSEKMDPRITASIEQVLSMVRNEIEAVT